jgi:hypothetical protein
MISDARRNGAIIARAVEELSPFRLKKGREKRERKEKRKRYDAH